MSIHRVIPPLEMPPGERQDGHMTSKSSRTNSNSARMKVSDRHRQHLYAAEDQFGAVLNRGGRIDFFGSTLDVPVQKRFGDLESVERYIEGVFASVRQSPPLQGITTPQVRERKGHTKAHYESVSRTIAVPLSGARSQWALRESVILHECAHHLAGFVAQGQMQAPHGPEFAACMLYLVRTVLGEQAELLLRTGYHEAGISSASIGAISGEGVR